MTADERLNRLERQFARTRRWFVSVAVLVGLLSGVSIGVALMSQRYEARSATEKLNESTMKTQTSLDEFTTATRTRLDNVEWGAAYDNAARSANSITPQVGTIQFLTNGYSIQLETVAYNAEGLHLTGFIGNPKNVWLGNLTLRFDAKPPLYSGRDEFLKKEPGQWNRFLVWLPSIGNGQTKPIAALGPGMRASFEVTVPNVKQTNEHVVLLVSFSGERYWYAP